MAYTPPDGDAAHFTWVDAAAYTAPDGDAADFAWSPEGGRAWVQGIPALGTPGAVASQSFGLAVGVPAGGVPQSLAYVRPAAWVQGIPGLGTPSILLAQQFAWATATPAAGLPATLARTGFLAHAQPLPALGIPQGMASWGYRLLAQPLPSLGTPRVFAWSLPAPAAIIPPGVTLYFCKITGAADGLADALLPISNFSVRHRQATASYYNVTIPSFAYVGALSARTHGEIVLWSERAGVSEELMRGALGDVSVSRGPNSQSISISGNASRAATPSFTYVIGEALYTSTTFAGDTRLRIEPRAAIRPGDYVRYQELNFAVGEVSWAVAVSAGGMAVTMEVASLPVEDGTGEPLLPISLWVMGDGLLGAPAVVADVPDYVGPELAPLPIDETLSISDEEAVQLEYLLDIGTYTIDLSAPDGASPVMAFILARFSDVPGDPYDCQAVAFPTPAHCVVLTASQATLHFVIGAMTPPVQVRLRVAKTA